MNEKDLAKNIIECAKKVHENLGNAFDVETYKKALEIELKKPGRIVNTQPKLLICYNNKPSGIKRFDYCIKVLSSPQIKIALKVVTDDSLKEFSRAEYESGIKDDEISAALVLNFGNKDFSYVSIPLAGKAELREKCNNSGRKKFEKFSDEIILFIITVVLSLFCFFIPDISCCDSLLLFSFPIVSIFISSIFILYINCKYDCPYFDDINMFEYCKNARKEQCDCKKNMLIWSYLVRKKWINKADWCLEKIVLWFVYAIHSRIDFFYNLIRLKHGVEENQKRSGNAERMDRFVDAEVFFLLLSGGSIYYITASNCLSENLCISVLIIFWGFFGFLCNCNRRKEKPDNPRCICVMSCLLPALIFLASILIFINYQKINNNTAELLLASFFIWRILTILFIKLNEILSHKTGGMYYSFNRSFINFMINLAEIVIAYSFLYTTRHFHVFKEERSFATIFKTLKIFTDWTTDGIGGLCTEQQFLVLSQIFVFIIMVTVFLTTMQNFNFLKSK